MSRFSRSAKGELIDFELLAIKQQLASAPTPKSVEARKRAIDAKDGVKTTVMPDLDMEMLAISTESASTSAGKQIKKK